MASNLTSQALAGLTDAGKFELLATAILRAADKRYASLLHPGVNADGKTIKAPLDGVTFEPDADPPHLIAVHHTICARDDLERKWLYDGSGPRRRGGKSTAPRGDVIKTAGIVNAERERTPNLRATLVLTTNQEPPEKLARNVYAVGRSLGFQTVDLWTRSRLAAFLDNDPAGQWLRRSYLDIAIERLSPELFAELSDRNLAGRAPFSSPESWVARSLDQVLTGMATQDVSFLVAESGLGKSVGAYRWLQRQRQSGAYALVVSHVVIAAAPTPERAAVMTLQELEPELQLDGGALLSLCSPTRPLNMVVEDINQSGQAQQLAEKIASWSRLGSKEGRASTAWRILCPLWPEVLTALPEQSRKRVEKLVIAGTSFTAEEGALAVARQAEIARKPVSPLEAQAVSLALGHDPLLIALNEPGRGADPHRTIGAYVERSLKRTAASRRDFAATEYAQTLRDLACGMLQRRTLAPEWSSLAQWPNWGRDAIAALRQLMHDGEVVRFAGPAHDQHVAFRHDRVRDWLLIDAASNLERTAALSDEIVGDPYFAELLGAAALEPDIGTEFVARLEQLNPLALFCALRLIGDPSVPRHNEIVAALGRWLDRPETHTASHVHLRWDALSVLSATQSSAVLPIAQRFKDRGSAQQIARFRNGDLTGGVELCWSVEPGSGASWRDIQLDHAKFRFGQRLTQTLATFLARSDLQLPHVSGALRLAGHIADPTLAPVLEARWKTDGHDSNLLADFLWAMAQCCGDDPARYLGPVCNAWETLPTTSDQSSSSPRDDLAADHVIWAFQKWPPQQAIPYFVQRAVAGELRWPITYMLHVVDDPAAMDFVARQLADIMRKVEEAGGFHPFMSMASEHWRRQQRERGRAMSIATRASLLSLWQDLAADRFLRRSAFTLWSATTADDDLQTLWAAAGDPVLADSILWQRLSRSDDSAIGELIAKLPADRSGYWWQCGRDIWSPALTEALEQALCKRRASLAQKVRSGLATDAILGELIMRLPVLEAEAMLSRHWDHVGATAWYVQAALYVATPPLLALVATTVAQSAEPKALFKHLGFHFGILISGHPGVTRIEQLQGLTPYLRLIESFDIDRMATVCNELGWFDFRARYLDQHSQAHRGDNFTSDEKVFASLDRTREQDRWYAMDYWVDGYLKQGGDWSIIADQLISWLGSSPTPSALRIVASAFCHKGRRADIERLAAFDRCDSPFAAQLKQDTIFAIRRRQLQ